jgi:spore maturation protein CgeB
MRSSLRILLVGEAWYGSLLYFCKTPFKELGHEVFVFDTSRFISGCSQSLMQRAAQRLTKHFSIHLLNKQLVKQVSERSAAKINVVVFFKNVYCFPETLNLIKGQTKALLFDWHTDDYFHPSASTKHAIESIPLYDSIFTVEKFNAPELQAAGAQRVAYLPLGYDSDLHRPVELSPEDQATYKTDVVFLGSWRKERAEILETLTASPFPYSLTIWGGQWENLGRRSPLKPYVKFKTACGIEMSKAICGAKIALAFVTRFTDQRVVHTMRTFEIPACGGFMLAERATGEYQEFFKEGEEMVCYEDVKSLREKIDYYLAQERARKAIAQAGHERLLRSGYSYRDRVKEILRVYYEIEGSEWEIGKPLSLRR